MSDISIEHLLKQRYKVIADYPGSKIKVGDIYAPPVNDEMKTFWDKYPHLFRKLEWWEERLISEMPQYVKYEVSGEIAKLKDHWNGQRLIVGGYGWSLKCCKPATESEYLTYINKKP